MKTKYYVVFLAFSAVLSVASHTAWAAPPIVDLELSLTEGLTVDRAVLAVEQSFSFPEGTPLFSLEIDQKEVTSREASGVERHGQEITFFLAEGIRGRLLLDPPYLPCWKAKLFLENTASRTRTISNLVPFGRDPAHIFITAAGPETVPLARANLFRPGKKPVGVILPDNAWDLGFTVIEGGSTSVCALIRKRSTAKAEVRRYRVQLQPGGTIEYDLYADTYLGAWQEGLRRMFRDHWLFDLDRFDNSLFERIDLAWIRKSYLIMLQFAWSHSFFDAKEKQSFWEPLLEEGRSLLGGYDVLGLWTTWPRLGLDSRSQWDLYGDLPGGLAQLKQSVSFLHKQGTRFFVAYNPWDKGARNESHMDGLSDLIRTTDADGVVLDTMGASSLELQQACDAVKPGVVLYSEGMATVKDMPSIVSGRVHDALFFSPILNLNKLIKPDFAIFRVCLLGQAPIRREISIAFFNGYGVELNAFAPGRPEGYREEWRYLGQALRILRENSSVFTGRRNIPLLATEADDLWVNEWGGSEKKIYTIYCERPEGYHGELFAAEVGDGYHFVDLWNHREIPDSLIAEKKMVPVSIAPFTGAWRDPRQNGSVGCIARLSKRLQVEADFFRGQIRIQAPEGRRLEIWKGNTSYETQAEIRSSGPMVLPMAEVLGRYRGPLILRLMLDGELEDEYVVSIPPGLPVKMPSMEKTLPAANTPDGMVEIRSGEFRFQVSKKEGLIPYPDFTEPRTVPMNTFYMDRYPVTNLQFRQFLEATQYRPVRDGNFLKHWQNDAPPKGEENHPVVYISLEDARAYADWAGKRLPTEWEWQYAAQATDGRSWPWGVEKKEDACNLSLGHSTAVDAFPSGVSPFGVADMVGNVWQLTDDEYDNGTQYFVIIRGGSFYDPKGSEWYLAGGPQPLDQSQMLLLVSPEYDRSPTVGFRCVKDAGQKP